LKPEADLCNIFKKSDRASKKTPHFTITKGSLTSAVISLGPIQEPEKIGNEVLYLLLGLSLVFYGPEGSQAKLAGPSKIIVACKELKASGRVEFCC
jgi:hypothetical protein